MRKYIFIIILWLHSCSFKEGGKFVITLTSPKSCWVFYSYPKEQMNNEKVILSSCTKFYDDYTFTPFVLKNKDAIAIRSVDKDISNNGEWSFNADDSIFSVGGQVFKIITFNVDTITLINDKNHLQKMVKAQFRERE